MVLSNQSSQRSKSENFESDIMAWVAEIKTTWGFRSGWREVAGPYQSKTAASTALTKAKRRYSDPSVVQGRVRHITAMSKRNL